MVAPSVSVASVQPSVVSERRLGAVGAGTGAVGAGNGAVGAGTGAVGSGAGAVGAGAGTGSVGASVVDAWEGRGVSAGAVGD